MCGDVTAYVTQAMHDSQCELGTCVWTQMTSAQVTKQDRTDQTRSEHNRAEQGTAEQGHKTTKQSAQCCVQQKRLDAVPVL